MGVAGDAMADELPRAVLLQVFLVEDLVYMRRRDFASRFIGYALDRTAELDLQAAGQRQAVFLLQQVRHAALAGLAVDANDRIVAPAHIGRVDRQIGHFPRRVGLLAGEALLDGVLV